MADAIFQEGDRYRSLLVMELGLQVCLQEDLPHPWWGLRLEELSVAIGVKGLNVVHLCRLYMVVSCFPRPILTHDKKKCKC